MTEATPAGRATLGESIAGTFNALVDPGGVAKYASKKGFWIFPLVLLCVVVLAVSLALVPVTLRVIEMNPPSNLSHEQFANALPAIRAATYGFSIASPLLVVAMLLISAWLVGIACSIVGVKINFPAIFSLLSACSVITVLQVIAGYIVIKLKGDEIESVQQLQPPFGLDIFFDGLKGIPYALLNFFSLFEVWYIIMLGLSLAALARTLKGKAFLVITPAWFVPLVFRLIGAALQP
jgi:hypothetical protein